MQVPEFPIIADREIGLGHSLSRSKLSLPAFDAPPGGSGYGTRLGAFAEPAAPRWSIAMTA